MGSKTNQIEILHSINVTKPCRFDSSEMFRLEGKIAERIRVPWTAHLVWTRSEELPGVGLFARRVVESWQRRKDASIWASCLVKLDV